MKDTTEWRQRTMLLLLCFTTTNAFISPSIIQSSPSPTSTSVVRQVSQGFSNESKSSSSSSNKKNKGGGMNKMDGKIQALERWASSVGIQTKGIQVKSGPPIAGGGLGLITTSTQSPNQVMLQVPNHLTFAVSTSTSSSECISKQVESYFDDVSVVTNAPWWTKMSLELLSCDKVSSLRSTTLDEDSDDDKVDMRPWLNCLPRSFGTPIHWSDEDRAKLQYNPMQVMVEAQDQSYQSIYGKLCQAAKSQSPFVSGGTKGKATWTYDDFVWGCECARSRAFSTTYSGNAFDAKPYLFTLVLVAAYVGLHLGTVEQAANGAAVVVCASILKDFVVPKLTKKSKDRKRYILCPYIDMANHVGNNKEEGTVAFEYFADGYSLSTKSSSGQDGASASDLSSGREVRISYGPRSNDALLQNYGFVETDNVHDVYVMPPLREWDIDALEQACGRKFQPGRLQKLDRAGLLGGSALVKSDDDDDSDDVAGNKDGGVVITRSTGIDPAIMTALRVLVSTDQEWSAGGEAVGNFVTENSGGIENERMVVIVAKKAIEMELASKDTSLEQDLDLMKEMKKDDTSLYSSEEQLAVAFRIEKKKLLKETLQRLNA